MLVKQKARNGTMGYSVGDKFVLEIKEIDNLMNHMVLENTAVGTDMLDKLERLDSDYVNEHFGELQDEAYEAGRKAGIEETVKWSRENEVEFYQQGLKDAWELARKLRLSFEDGGFSHIDVGNIFGMPEYQVFQHILPLDALEMVEAYEKKQMLVIKVGDIVIPRKDRYREGKEGLVIEVLKDKRIRVIHKDENGYLDFTNYKTENLEKTGRKLNIQSILNQIGGGIDGKVSE